MVNGVISFIVMAKPKKSHFPRTHEIDICASISAQRFSEARNEGCRYSFS